MFLSSCGRLTALHHHPRAETEARTVKPYTFRLRFYIPLPRKYARDAYFVRNRQKPRAIELSGTVRVPTVCSYRGVSTCTGNVTVMRVPQSGWLSSAISAPWKVAACFTMASPKPVPPRAFERLLSTR